MGMRTFDVPYVKRGPGNYYPAKDLQDMTLDEIKKKYIKTCGKANGDISVCSKCLSPCKEGQRATQLLANEVLDMNVPLYGGMTLIQKAQEENRKRREKMEEQNMVEEKQRRKYTRNDEWWEKSLESGDQVKWLMTEMGYNKTQAKKKIYQYKFNHGMAGSSVQQKEETVEAKVVETEEKEMKTGIEAVESRLEHLMKLQEECKKNMEYYLAKYEEAKVSYEQLKQKTDILCSALDIVNE